MVKLETPAFIVSNARKINGLTQSEFGKKIGRPQSIVSKYERGLVEPPAHIIIQCMNILKRDKPKDISSSAIAQLVEKHLSSPDFAPVRLAIAELIESVSSHSSNM